MIKLIKANDYPAVRESTFQLLADTSTAFIQVAQEQTITFDLVVESNPAQQAAISLKRRGDADYTTEGSFTNTTIKNLVLARWLCALNFRAM